MSSKGGWDCWAEFLSPWRLVRIAISGVCFGGCLVFLVMGKRNGATVLLTAATGLMLAASLTGALVASRRMRKGEGSEATGSQ